MRIEGPGLRVEGSTKGCESERSCCARRLMAVRGVPALSAFLVLMRRTCREREEERASERGREGASERERERERFTNRPQPLSKKLGLF